jgi:hypothetical protein
MLFEHDPNKCGICAGAAEQKRARERPGQTAPKSPIFLASAYAREGWGRP